jgi:hypothetical protein
MARLGWGVTKSGRGAANSLGAARLGSGVLNLGCSNAKSGHHA